MYDCKKSIMAKTARRAARLAKAKKTATANIELTEEIKIMSAPSKQLLSMPRQRVPGTLAEFRQEGDYEDTDLEIKANCRRTGS